MNDRNLHAELAQLNSYLAKCKSDCRQAKAELNVSLYKYLLGEQEVVRENIQQIERWIANPKEWENYLKQSCELQGYRPAPVANRKRVLRNGVEVINTGTPTKLGVPTESAECAFFHFLFEEKPVGLWEEVETFH